MHQFYFGEQAAAWKLVLAMAVLGTVFGTVFWWNWYAQARKRAELLPVALRAHWARRWLLIVIGLASAAAAWALWLNHSQFYEMQTDGQIVELTFAMPERRVRLNDQDVSSITVSSASKGGMASVVICAKDDRCWRSRKVTEERRCKVWKHFAGDRRLAHVNPRLCG